MDHIGLDNVKLVSALKADPIGPMLDRENAAQSFVMTPVHELKNPTQEFH
jgi:hypothetical protein